MGNERRITPNDCTKNRVALSVIDILCVGIVALPLLLLNQLGQPFHRGFFCNDETIKYPYHDSTISSAALYSVGFISNFVGFLLIEGVILYRNTKGKINSNTVDGNHGNRSSRQENKKSYHQYFCAVYTILLPFLFGASVQHLTTDIAKYSVGRLRPHFLTICKPDYSSFSCNDSIGYRYVEEDVCTGDKDLIRQGRLSFPSGHASFSSYTMVFLTLYIQYKFTWKELVILKPFLQVIFLYMSYYTCISRVFDYKHHWTDVLTGAIIGVTHAVIVVYCLTDLPKLMTMKRNCQSEKEVHHLPNTNTDLAAQGTENVWNVQDHMSTPL